MKEKELNKAIENYQFSDSTIKAVDGKQAPGPAATETPQAPTAPANPVKRNTFYSDVETKTKRIQLLVQPSIYNATREAATSQGFSINEYIIQAIIAFNNSKI